METSEGLLAVRVEPLESRAGQMQTMARVVGRMAVDQIAHHGVSQCRSVPPDLVGAPREQFEFDQAGVFVELPKFSSPRT